MGIFKSQTKLYVKLMYYLIIKLLKLISFIWILELLNECLKTSLCSEIRKMGKFKMRFVKGHCNNNQQ